MGLDAATFLTMAAVVLGLILRVGLFGATFGNPAIPAPARRGEGDREGERCREERLVRLVRRYADFVDFSGDDSLSDVVVYASPCVEWSPCWESTRAPR